VIVGLRKMKNDYVMMQNCVDK